MNPVFGIAVQWHDGKEANYAGLVLVEDAIREDRREVPAHRRADAPIRFGPLANLDDQPFDLVVEPSAELRLTAEYS